MNENSTPGFLLLQYLDGELSPEEMARLEQEISRDSVKRDTLEGLSLARQAVRSWGLQNKIASIHQELSAELTWPAKESSGSRSSFRLYFLRAVAALLILMFGTLAYQYSQVSSQKIYGEIYTAYELPLSRGAANISDMIKRFREKDYAAVITLFARERQASLQEDFLAAQAYQQTGGYQQAISLYREILQKDRDQHSSQYADDAQFYLALCYLQLKEPDLALPLFTAIHQDPEHLYHDRVSAWQLQQIRLLLWKK